MPEEKEPKWIKILTFIIFIIAFVCSKAIVHSVRASIHEKKKANLQLMKDAGFVKGFEIINTSELENFCSDSDYIPYIYISNFKKQFAKTIENADNILNQNFTQEELEYIYKKIENSNALEEEYQKFNSQYNLTKTEFCKIYDKFKEEIIQDKIQIFRENKNHMYYD